MINRRSALLVLSHCGAFALAALLMGCASTPEVPPRESARAAFAGLHEHIEQTIEDADRRVVLLDYATELEAMMTQAADEKKVLGEALLALNRNYNASAEDFAGLFASWSTRKAERQRRLLEIYSVTRGLMTEAEWQSASAFKVLALAAALSLMATPEALP